MSFNFALVGTGNIAKTYFEIISCMHDVKVVAIVTRQEKKPDWAIGEVELSCSIENIKSKFDGVILATPNGTHLNLTLAAAKLKKHVLTEKVLEVSTKSGQKMIDVCRENSVVLGVSYQRRFSPDNLIVSELIAQGKIGKLIGAELKIPFYREQSYYDSAAYRGNRKIDGGGAFIQQAAHQIDLYGWFFGLPEKVHSELGLFMHDMECEDYGVALLRHENGMIGTIIASTCTYPGFSPEIKIISEKGTIRMVNDVIVDWHIKGINKPESSRTVDVHCGADSASVAKTDGHERIIEDFVDAVRTNREPVVNGENGIIATQLIDMIYKNSTFSKS